MKGGRRGMKGGRKGNRTSNGKRGICLALAALIGLLGAAGCGGMWPSDGSRWDPVSPVEAPDAAGTETQMPDAAGTETQMPEAAGTEMQTPESGFFGTGTDGNALFDGSRFPGSVTALEYAGPGKLLVCADALSLYDAASDQILGEYRFPGETPLFRGFYPIDGGYVLFGDFLGKPLEGGTDETSGGQGEAMTENAENPGMTVITGNEEGLRCWFFDEHLGLLKSLDLHRLLKEQEGWIVEQSAAVSRDGTKIAISSAGSGKTYLYSVTENTFRVLLQTSAEVKSGNLRYLDPGNLCFTGQSGSSSLEGLIFTGIAIPEGQSNSVPIYGTIREDGSGLNCHTLSDYPLSGEMIPYEEEIWFPEDFQKASGKLLVTDREGQIVRRVELEGEDTGADGIFGSDSGKYLATAGIPGDINQWKGGWRLRIYDAATGSILWEHPVGTDTGAYEGVSIRVRILDEQRECIVVLGRGEHTLVESYAF